MEQHRQHQRHSTREASVLLWVNGKNRIGNQLRRSDADNRAIGGTLNLNSLWSKLGTFSISYNAMTAATTAIITRQITIKVLTAVPLVRLACGRGIQRYNNGDSSANTGKYIALDPRYHGQLV